jgi:hypothetical protein
LSAFSRLAARCLSRCRAIHVATWTRLLQPWHSPQLHLAFLPMAATYGADASWPLEVRPESACTACYNCNMQYSSPVLLVSWLECKEAAATDIATS